MKFKASVQEIFADRDCNGEKLNAQFILHLQSDMNVKTVFLKFWSFRKRKKAIFYFFRVQTQGVLNVFIRCGRFLFLQHNIQTLNFGAGYIFPEISQNMKYTTSNEMIKKSNCSFSRSLCLAFRKNMIKYEQQLTLDSP